MKALLSLFILLYVPFATPDNVLTRFSAPAGYHQESVQPGSFAAYLQNLPLKPSGTHTLTYKGAVAATDVETA
ncbi:MAG TPA: hypothetical protein VFE54_13205, partial [Mucilaginibacter sp.]|nr:hypothetical protein [Mucilaginibacter sp.]